MSLAHTAKCDILNKHFRLVIRLKGIVHPFFIFIYMISLTPKVVGRTVVMVS